MVSSREAESLIADYDRHFAALSELAAALEVPPEEAADLIHDVLTSALLGRYINDIDTWLAAALTSAITHRGSVS
jgi:DNA-directed RNA polymerase specialized sigma24 family protein